jgi:DNA-binding LacI/PurR family transcriptional regulator
MADVAARAGVSHQTVSRVVNEHPSVLPATRARVLEAIDELGYRPNNAARALVTRRTGVLGVISAGGAHYGPTSTLLELEDAAREAGYMVVVAALGRGDGGDIDQALRRLLDLGVEGIAVVAPTIHVAQALAGVRSAVPAVLVSSFTPGPRMPDLTSVAVGQREGARLATAHLLEQGHREVVHLAGPQDWFDARERLVGWRAACLAAGAAVPEPIEGSWEASRGFEVGRRLLAEGLPTAVFAANDQLALGLMRALAEGGVRVPQDVAVVGFDDEPGAAYYAPPLTTVRQDFGALGRAAVAALVAALDGRRPLDAVLTPELVVRASSVRTEV